MKSSSIILHIIACNLFVLDFTLCFIMPQNTTCSQFEKKTEEKFRKAFKLCEFLRELSREIKTLDLLIILAGYLMVSHTIRSTFCSCKLKSPSFRQLLKFERFSRNKDFSEQLKSLGRTRCEKRFSSWQAKKQEEHRGLTKKQ